MKSLISGIVCSHRFFGAWLATLLFALLCCIGTAHATVFSGSFAGTTANSTWPGMPDGTPITGSFRFDSKFNYRFVDGDGATFAHYQSFNVDPTADPVHLNFGGMDVNGFGLLDVWLLDTDEGQAVSFSSYFIHGFGGGLTLAGSDGSFFDGVDLATFRMGTPDPSRSIGHMAVHGGYENDVLLHSLTLEHVSEVPESGTAMLVGLALAGLLASRWKRDPRRTSTRMAMP